MALLQSLHAELAAAEQEKQTLLQQGLHPYDRQNDLDVVSEGTQATGAAKDQVPQADSLPPKAPGPLNHANLKQPPLRSLSWGSSPKPCPRPSQQPQRRSTFNLVDSAVCRQQEQPVQQQVIQHWLCQEQSSAAASNAVDIHCVKQEVLQEVLQAVTLATKTSTTVDFNNLTVQVHC